MPFFQNRWRFCATLVFCLATGTFAAGQPASKQSLQLTGGATAEVDLHDLSTDEYYGVLVSLPTLAELGEPDRIDLILHDAAGEVIRKRLHGGDADFYFTLRPRKSGTAKIVATASGTPGKSYTLTTAIEPIVFGGKSKVTIAAGPNNTWQTAQPMELGRTVFASNDERPYIPADDG